MNTKIISLEKTLTELFDGKFTDKVSPQPGLLYLTNTFWRVVIPDGIRPKTIFGKIGIYPSNIAEQILTSVEQFYQNNKLDKPMGITVDLLP